MSSPTQMESELDWLSSVMNPPPYEELTREVTSELARLARLSRTVASKKPGDQHAQRRAQAATAFVKDMGGYTPNAGDEETLSVHNPSGIDLLSPVLPLELYQLIINYVAGFDYKLRQNTLVALSSTCRLFMGLAEEHIYEHPRDLDNIRQQWLFLYSLRMEPSRATLVKSLRLLWLCDGANSKLLIDIVASCRDSRSLLIQRGDDLQDSCKISHNDMLTLGALIRACPELISFYYSAMVDWAPEGERYTDTVDVTLDGVVNPLSVDGHLKQAMRQLSELTLCGQAGWAVNGLFPHLASSLTSLRLSQDVSLGNWEDPLTQLSQQCPFLERIEIRQTLDTATDLEKACKAWGKALKSLKISSVAETDSWVARIMPYMVSLEELFLGYGCFVQTEDIGAIALSKSPLEKIGLGDMQYSDEHIASDALNAVIVAMIEAHSSTLQYLGMTADPSVDITVLQACRKAKGLRYLGIWLHATPEPTDVDILLDECVYLDDYPTWFWRYSLRLDEWQARRFAREIAEEEELNRGPPTNGLGS
ncbi:hypothetical protein FAVG1_02704 [Fusarium avenaceum]|nr:hypothetical protein FAVG1_02704 [Fusarium avenaceum]